MLSNALVKSMKLIARGNSYSLYFFIMRLSVIICSAQERLGLKPACSTRSLPLSHLEFGSVSCGSSFLDIDSSVTPLQLSRSPVVCHLLPPFHVNTGSSMVSRRAVHIVEAWSPNVSRQHRQLHGVASCSPYSGGVVAQRFACRRSSQNTAFGSRSSSIQTTWSTLSLQEHGLDALHTLHI